MAELINTSNRQLIPRWHTSRKMELLQQITLPVLSKEEDGALFRVEEKQRRWESSPSVKTAVDLFVRLQLANMTSSPMFNRVKRYLISNQNEISNTVRDVVSPRLRRLDSSNTYTTDKDRIYEMLSILKGFVRDRPHDSLTWNDLAFYYAVIGERRRSEYSMHVAYSLNPSHPFIARSYARLLVHYQDQDKAIHVLKNTGEVKNHPEILSADIAIRTAFGIGRPDISTARRLIDKFSNRPNSISELSASVGTLEVESGALKKGKEHLVTSSIAPTENTIAQLQWMSQQHKIIIPVGNATVGSLEADAISYYNTKQYSRCRETLMTLHKFQPFSEGALVDAGYISLVALDDPNFVCKFSECFRGVILGNFSALNNYIVSKLEMDSLDGMEKMLHDLSSLANEEKDKAVLSATIGMYLYRIADIDSGRKQYEKTKAYFKAARDSFGHTLMLIHQGMSEKRLDLGNARPILEQAKKEAMKIGKSPELLEKIKRELG